VSEGAPKKRRHQAGAKVIDLAALLAQSVKVRRHHSSSKPKGSPRKRSEGHHRKSA
jgi:non-homologous end joining protein Ku